MEAVGRAPARPNVASRTTADRSQPGSDLALVRRAAQHDEAAWRELYERTRSRLFALLVYHTGQRDDALELLQETYLSAIRSLHSYDGRGPIEAWFAVIAIRRAQDWKRSLLRRRRCAEALARARDPEPAMSPQRIPDDDQRRRLHQALARLSGRERAAFLLRELEGLSFRAVGRALGCCEATARFHHFRARHRMRRFLLEEPNDPDASPRPAPACGRGYQARPKT